MSIEDAALSFTFVPFDKLVTRLDQSASGGKEAVELLEDRYKHEYNCAAHSILASKTDLYSYEIENSSSERMLGSFKNWNLYLSRSQIQYVNDLKDKVIAPLTSNTKEGLKILQQQRLQVSNANKRVADAAEILIKSKKNWAKTEKEAIKEMDKFDSSFRDSFRNKEREINGTNGINDTQVNDDSNSNSTLNQAAPDSHNNNINSSTSSSSGSAFSMNRMMNSTIFGGNGGVTGEDGYSNGAAGNGNSNKQESAKSKQYKKVQKRVQEAHSCKDEILRKKTDLLEKIIARDDSVDIAAACFLEQEKNRANNSRDAMRAFCAMERRATEERLRLLEKMEADVEQQSSEQDLMDYVVKERNAEDAMKYSRALVIMDAEIIHRRNNKQQGGHNQNHNHNQNQKDSHRDSHRDIEDYRFHDATARFRSLSDWEKASGEQDLVDLKEGARLDDDVTVQYDNGINGIQSREVGEGGIITKGQIKGVMEALGAAAIASIFGDNNSNSSSSSSSIKGKRKEKGDNDKNKDKDKDNGAAKSERDDATNAAPGSNGKEKEKEKKTGTGSTVSSTVRGGGGGLGEEEWEMLAKSECGRAQFLQELDRRRGSHACLSECAYNELANVMGHFLTACHSNESSGDDANSAVRIANFSNTFYTLNEGGKTWRDRRGKMELEKIVIIGSIEKVSDADTGDVGSSGATNDVEVEVERDSEIEVGNLPREEDKAYLQQDLRVAQHPIWHQTDYLSFWEKVLLERIFTEMESSHPQSVHWDDLGPDALLDEVRNMKNLVFGQLNAIVLTMKGFCVNVKHAQHAVFLLCREAQLSPVQEQDLAAHFHSWPIEIENSIENSIDKDKINCN